MIAVNELKAAYPAKEIIFLLDGTYHPNDVVKLPDGREIRLDAHIHMTFLKEEIASDYFRMTLLHNIGELYPFKDEAIKTIVVASAPAEEKSELVGFLRITESNKTSTFTFLAGGE